MKRAKVYELGLVKRGADLVLQLADSRDQLSCELFKYIGPRENTLANLRRKQAQLADALRREGFQFSRFRIERVASGNYAADHVSTLPVELAEMRA